MWKSDKYDRLIIIKYVNRYMLWVVLVFRVFNERIWNN